MTYVTYVQYAQFYSDPHLNRMQIRAYYVYVFVVESVAALMYVCERLSLPMLCQVVKNHFGLCVLFMYVCELVCVLHMCTCVCVWCVHVHA